MAMKLQRFLYSLVLLLSLLSLSACSSDNLKDRISVCKAVVKQLLEIPVAVEIDWEAQQQTTAAQSAVTVRLKFNIHEQVNDDLHTDHFSASCVYAYSDVAEYEVVGHEYEDSPTDVYIYDKMVGRFTLTEAVNAVMLNSVQGLFKQ
jgi:hypothetical protein